MAWNSSRVIVQEVYTQKRWAEQLLVRNNFAPWNYADFLDYAAERKLLHKIGGGYRFIHELLRDYLAEQRPGSGPA